eukprot:2958100-Pyramimonas_sp.AAC.1
MRGQPPAVHHLRHLLRQSPPALSTCSCAVARQFWLRWVRPALGRSRTQQRMRPIVSTSSTFLIAPT